jgi:predicted acetyltransferase
MTVEARIVDGVLDEHPFCRLVLPSIEYRRSFAEGAAEFAAKGRLDSTYAPFLGYDLAGLDVDFAGFVAGLQRLAEPARVQQAGYRDRVLWLIDDGDYIGQASLRPELGTPYLLTYGGHVGYSIRPSRRRRGYGRRILELALHACADFSLERILVTCDEDNVASRRIIEANGGRFESGLLMDPAAARAEGRPGQKVRKLRYWFDLGESGA